MPGACLACPLRTRKAAWIRFNRLLAWTLVASPGVQLAAGMRFVDGLWIDLALFVAHGMLSLALFGRPRGLTRFQLWAGLGGAKLSPRDRFLLGAWRLVLSVLYAPVLLAMPWVLLAVGVPLLAFVWGMVMLVLWLLPPWHVLAHVHGAADYALRRWGARNRAGRNAARLAIALAFGAAGVVNLFR